MKSTRERNGSGEEPKEKTREGAAHRNQTESRNGVNTGTVHAVSGPWKKLIDIVAPMHRAAIRIVLP
jgi:hypothetical protein